MDAFDAIPDPLVINILNKVRDVKTLIRCRSVSKRFNSLATESDSLILQLDQIGESDSDNDSPITTFFRTISKSIHGFFSKPAKISTPVQILAGFNRIRSLEVELHGGDVKLEKGAAVKWKAEFGESLKSCVIVAFRSATANNASTNDGDDRFGVCFRFKDARGVDDQRVDRGLHAPLPD